MTYQIGSGPNIFRMGLEASKKLVSNPRQERDMHQASNIEHAVMMGAVNYEATKKHTAQQARLSERAEQGKHERATHFANTIQGFAQPGAQVSITHGGISASYTPKMPTTQKPGRVPVKKNRGGKRPQ
jgi:hypothetical protein